MKYVITIEDDPRTGRVGVTVEGPESPDRRNRVVQMFDLIIAAVAAKFKPVRTLFVPRRKRRS